MKENKEALNYFVQLFKEGKLIYDSGDIWKHWEPRRNWLSEVKRAEKLTYNGYYMLRTMIKEKGKYYSVMAHRAIWVYFKGSIPENIEINHINGIKTDNRIENLELVTSKENKQHAKRNGMLRSIGTKNGRTKLSDDDVRKIRNLLANGMKQKEIAGFYGVVENMICRINTGQSRGRVMQEPINTFSDFQKLSKRTMSDEDSYNKADSHKRALSNYGLGLAGETGEVIDLLKKAMFHGHELNLIKLQEELGDVLFYVAAISTTMGLNLEEIAQANIDKLKTRYPDGFSYEASKNRVSG